MLAFLFTSSTSWLWMIHLHQKQLRCLIIVSVPERLTLMDTSTLYGESNSGSQSNQTICRREIDLHL